MQDKWANWLRAHTQSPKTVTFTTINSTFMLLLSIFKRNISVLADLKNFINSSELQTLKNVCVSDARRPGHFDKCYLQNRSVLQKTFSGVNCHRKGEVSSLQLIRYFLDHEQSCKICKILRKLGRDTQNEKTSIKKMCVASIKKHANILEVIRQ